MLNFISCCLSAKALINTCWSLFPFIKNKLSDITTTIFIAIILIKRILFSLCCILPFTLRAQNSMLSAEERAVVFHVVAQSPALLRNIGNYFTYRGDTTLFIYSRTLGIKGRSEENFVIDWESIEKKIILEPSLLEINEYEFPEIEAGFLSEISSKAALLLLHRQLKNRHEKRITGASYQYIDQFLSDLSQNLPVKAVKFKNGATSINSEIDDLLDPNLIFNERVIILENLKGYSVLEQQQIITAIHSTINTYVLKITKEFYTKLCGRKEILDGALLAAGDGSGTSGLLGERELDKENGNRLGKPKGVGLFTYESYIDEEEKNRQVIKSRLSVARDFKAIPNEMTNFHLSIWGFNFRHQSTVVISRDGYDYCLYGSKLTHELSPDSAFGKGRTIYSNLDLLKSKWIPKVEESLYGKGGIAERLDFHKKELEDNTKKIMETEYTLNELRRDQVKNKNTIKTYQSRLSNLYHRKGEIQKNVNRLEEEFRNEQLRLQRYRLKLVELNGYLANIPRNYTQFGHVYTFEDGCTFNSLTQNFKVPDSLKAEKITIRLITIGEEPTAELVDEVQLQVGVTRGIPEDKSIKPFSLILNDFFKSDNYKIDKLGLSEIEKYELGKLLLPLIDHKWDIQTELSGNGVGILGNNGEILANSIEMDAYPGENDSIRKLSRNSHEFKALRLTQVKIDIETQAIKITVSSFTDPVKSNLSTSVKGILELKSSFPGCTDNDILSAFRTFAVMEKLVMELMRSAYFNFDGKSKTKLLAILKKKLEKTEVKIKNGTIFYENYAKIAHPDKSFYSFCIADFEAEEIARKLKLTM